jgi:hypothetical protein
MALKDEVPSFEKGSPDLGGQLRELAAVVAKLCVAQEALDAASAAPAAPKAPAVTKPTSAAAKAPAAK